MALLDYQKVLKHLPVNIYRRNSISILTSNVGIRNSIYIYIYIHIPPVVKCGNGQLTIDNVPIETCI